jgi:hypothetical protein
MHCALCRKETELKRSHIISEFLYKAMYDEIHRFHVLSSVPDLPDSMSQKGLREKLLCGACETHLSRFEMYARNVLSGGVPLEYKKEGRVVQVYGVDYAQFKLFQLSILWRSGISTLEMFKKVKLGPHESELRRMLVESDPGLEHTYGCIMFGLVDDTGNRMDMIVQPRKIHIDGHACYRFIFAGFMWVYFVTNRKPTGQYTAGFLKTTGELVFVIKNILEARDIVNFAKARVALAGRKKRRCR